MSIEFPLVFNQTPFGWLSDPRIPVTVRGPSIDRRFRFLVDTGAAFALGPRRLAGLAGLDWARLAAARVVGVEQGSLPARLGPLRIRIGSAELTIRCLFVDNPRTPLLLGRADFLDRFVVTIDRPGGRIVLTDVQSPA